MFPASLPHPGRKMPLNLLLLALWRLRWRMAGIVALILAAGVTLLLLWPRQYVASAVIAPAETTGLATSTLIQSTAVLQTGSLLDNRPGGNFAVYLALLRSPEAAAMLARDTRLPRWLTEQRASGLMGWVREVFDLRLTSDSDDLERWLERNLAVTQSLSAVTVTLELPHPDRAVALDALGRLHAFAESKVRADLAELAARRTATLQERLARERDVYLRTPLYELLAQHQRASLVLLADTAVAARLVSAPAVDLAPTLPNRPLLVLLLLVAAPMATVLGTACLILLRLPGDGGAFSGDGVAAASDPRPRWTYPEAGAGYATQAAYRGEAWPAAHETPLPAVSHARPTLADPAE